MRISDWSSDVCSSDLRWAGDERRLSQACHAVLEFMQRHPIAATWGRTDLASSDMMSMETTQRVWQARQDPRRNTSSIGIYSHVRDRWRSEEHTSELQSLIRISYAVFCLKKKKKP